MLGADTYKQFILLRQSDLDIAYNGKTTIKINDEQQKCVYSYLLIYFISASLFADELSEAFIEIKTNERYDSFFRVLLDDETPYLNISTLLPLLYGLDRKCDSERCHYFIALRPNDGQTTINFKEKHCNSTTNKKVHNINVHYIEEQYWLHWKDIAICFNANVYWDTDSYILNIQTQYLSPTDIQKAIDRAPPYFYRKAKQIKKISDSTPYITDECNNDTKSFST